MVVTNMRLIRNFSLFIQTLLLFTLASCASPTPNPLDDLEEVMPATVLEHPPAASEDYPREVMDRGLYLVNLLRCGACHTDGALVGRPDFNHAMAGSSVGIAYTNPLDGNHPGVVFPSNLTPDKATGLGNWSVEQIAEMIRLGTDNHGSRQLSVMPYPAYSSLSLEDAHAIAVYLYSLEPVQHKVPFNVSPGQKTTEDYVHFGVYRSRE